MRNIDSINNHFKEQKLEGQEIIMSLLIFLDSWWVRLICKHHYVNLMYIITSESTQIYTRTIRTKLLLDHHLFYSNIASSYLDYSNHIQLFLQIKLFCYVVLIHTKGLSNYILTILKNLHHIKNHSQEIEEEY